MLREIIQGTGETHTLELRAIANLCTRPYLEYLYKGGQHDLARELMRCDRLPKHVVANVRGNNLRTLLGLSESQAQEAKAGVKLNVEMLQLLHELRGMGVLDIRLGEIQNAMNHLHSSGYAVSVLARIREITEGMPDKLRRKLARRILREITQCSEWRDYLEQLKRLGEDMTSSALILPKDMMEMHRRMTDRENTLRDELRARALDEQTRKFREQLLPKLKKAYTFSACGLELRPFETAKEIIDEGRAQQICIGSYAERYMQGGTVICTLRLAEEPDEPWRDIEFDALSGIKVQDRGYRNDRKSGRWLDRAQIDPGTQVRLDRFWTAFEKWRKTA